MRVRRCLPAAVLLGVACAGAARAADNPLAGNAQAIEVGAAIYRSRCSGCHGKDARGYLGPDLTGLWSAGRSDDSIVRIVRAGVPGTEMPPHDPQRLLDRELWSVLAYLRNLGGAATSANVSGNAENGARLFRVNCARCHLVKGQGGELGPDLSRIGSARSRSALAAKLRGTSDNIRPGFEPVTIVLRDGTRVHGVKKNEDEFSIQIVDTTERLQGHLKAAVAQVIPEGRSLMPVFGPERLPDRDLDDLLRYLGTLRTADAAAR
jgi:putative heme-binding domain-containing protein